MSRFFALDPPHARIKSASLSTRLSSPARLSSGQASELFPPSLPRSVSDHNEAITFIPPSSSHFVLRVGGIIERILCERGMLFFIFGMMRYECNISSTLTLLQRKFLPRRYDFLPCAGGAACRPALIKDWPPLPDKVGWKIFVRSRAA